jgi:hypothetical protein
MLFFLDEKVLLLPVVYEKYNYLLLSMNFNAEFYKFYFTGLFSVDIEYKV